MNFKRHYRIFETFSDSSVLFQKSIIITSLFLKYNIIVMDDVKKKAISSRYNGPLSPKKKFSKAEDEQLKKLVLEHGIKKWGEISKFLPSRTARQCRDRWENYLNPVLNVQKWTMEEDRILLEKHAFFGNKWKKINLFLPSRSKIAIKNRYHKLVEKLKNPSPCQYNPINYGVTYCVILQPAFVCPIQYTTSQ